MKNELDTLLQKQMDRKAFLKHVGIGFVAITGLATLLKTLTSVSTSSSSVGGSHLGSAYGASVYGGRREQPKS